MIALVRGEPVRARVPAGLTGDRYRAFVRERVYQREALALAKAQGLSLTDRERAEARARVPAPDAVAVLLRRQQMTHGKLVQQELDVALIQKLERREVFDRIAVAQDVDPRSRFEQERIAFDRWVANILAAAAPTIVEPPPE